MLRPQHIHPFLLSLVRGELGGGQEVPPGEQPEWDRILAEAAAQGLLPNLHHWLKSSGGLRQLAVPHQDWLRTEVLRLAAQNALLAEELRAILRQCHARQVACAPIRGLALAELLYGEDLPRSMGDIDLLVKKETLPEVTEILTGLGFRPVGRRTGFAEVYDYTLTFTKERRGQFFVEPHWTIAYPPFTDSVDMEGVWRRAVEGPVLGVPGWLLDPHDLVLHLCWHLIHWRERAPLLWYHELDRLLRRDDPRLDWTVIVTRARESGQMPFVVEAAKALKALCHTPVPDQVLTRPLGQPVPQTPGRAAGLLQRRALELLVHGTTSRGREEFALFLSLSGVRARLRYALPLLFPSPDYMRVRYGPCGRVRLVLHYVARVWNLSRQAASWVKDLAFGR